MRKLLTEKKERKKDSDTNVQIKDLQSENEKLKNRIIELEDELRRKKNSIN